MFKLKVLKKIVAITANLSLLLNSFLPFLLVAQPAYAQSPETIVSSINYDSSANKINVIADTSEKNAYQLFYKADENINAIAGSDLSQANFYLGTCSAGVCLPQNVSRGILKIESDSEFYSQFFTLENNVLTVTQQSDSTQSDLTTEENDFLNASVLGATTEWTFKNVELNKEYVAPQNSGVKLTFTKLPEISGNIKIEEITLNKEQIEQTRSLSNKAYDITSDMKDGTFAYNLSLPIPESSKGQNVDIKFAEEISQIDSAKTAGNTTETNSTISAANLDHFTIFIVSATLTTATLNNQSQVTVYPNDTIKATLNVNLNKYSGWKYSGWKIDNGIWHDVDTPNHISGWSTFSVSEDFNIYAPDSAGTYDVSFKVCPLMSFNDCEVTTLTDGIIVQPFCGNSKLDLDEQCDNGDQNGQVCVPGYNAVCNYCTNECKTASVNNLDTVAPTANIIYSNTNPTNQSITATLIPSENVTVTSAGGFTHTFNENGVFTFNFRDDAGNLGSDTATVNNIDITPPIITIDNYSTAPTNQDIIVTASTNEGILNTTSHTFTANDSFDFIATDAVGNSSNIIVVVTNIDKTAPSVPTNGTPKNISISTNNFDFNWDDSVDNNFAVTYEFQSSLNPAQINSVLATSLWPSGILPTSMIHSSGAPDGTWYWQVRAVDNAGNKSAWSPIWQVTLDTKAPTATISYSTLNPTNKSVIATLDPSENIIVTNNLALNTYTFINNGSFTFEFRDTAGNVGSAVATVNNIDNSIPSIPTGIYYKDTVNNKIINCGDKTNTKHLNVYWNKNNDPDFDHYEYVSFNADGSTGSIRTFTDNYFNASWWTIPSEGTYGVQIRAVDKAGNKSAWFGGLQNVANSCKYIVDWTAPIITVDDYSTVLTNKDIIVTASTNEGSLNTTSHTFTTNGSFDFIATDSAGNSTTKTVTINNIDKEKPTTPQSMDFKNPNLSCGSITNQKNTTIDWSDSSDNVGVVGYDYSIDYPNGNTRGKWNTSFIQSQYRGSLNEGIHYIQVRAKDAAGNVSDWTNLCSITYDSIAPIITVNPFITNNKTPTLTGTINDNTAVVSVKVNSINYAATNNNGIWSVVTSALADGTYDVIANATDTAGNIGIDKTTNELTVDTVAPKATFKHFINETEFTGSIAYVNNINKLTFTGEYTDAPPSSGLLKDSYVIFDAQTDHSFKFSQNGAKSYCSWRTEPNLVDGLSGTSFSLTNKESFTNCINDLSEGEYYMTHQVYDNAIRQDIPSITQFRDVLGLHFVVDKTNPIITASVNPTIADAQNGWYKTQPEITLTGTDTNLDKVEYQWDSQVEGSWTNYSIAVKPLTEGNHDLYYRAIDKAGNVSTIGSQNIKWDQTDLEYGPQNLSANPNPTSGSTSKIKWEIAKDNTGIDKYEIQWKLNGGNANYYSKTVSAGTTEVEIDNLTEGRWTVKVIAFNQSGRTKDASIDLNVDRSGPSAPVLTLTNTGAGSATLSWNAISDAKDYIIWYGSVQGVHEFGARVGNVTSYTVKGLGAGNYYFIVKAVDEAQNQSNDSNEVNTGNIAGAAGTIPGQRAEGFTPEVLGATTEATPSAEKGSVLGTSEDKEGFNWWWLLLLLVIPVYIGGKKISKKKK